MMRHLSLTTIAAAVLFAGLGLAQDGAPEGEPETINANELPPAAEPACFMTRQVRNFDALDDRYVFVEGPRDEFYLLTMNAACFGLRNAIGIAIQSNMSQVCTNSGAEIAYRDAGRLQTCRIQTVEAVADKATAEALIESRAR